MVELSKYEAGARSEIETWKQKESGILSTVLGGVGWLANKVGSVVPNVIADPIMKAVLGALEALKDGALWTYSDAQILKEAQKIGLQANSVSELRGQDLELLDKLAQRQFTSNKVAAFLEGGALGFGGGFLIAAEVPALFMLSFRAIQQIGSSYGFDMSNPNMRPVVLSILSAGSGASAAAKTGLLLDMTIAAEAFAAKWTYEKVAKQTATGAAAKALREATKHLPKKIAENVAKRKLAQAIPFVGAGIGAGFNYWFLSTTCETAYMAFRDLHIRRRLQE